MLSPEAHAVGDAHGNGNDVLECGAQLHAHRVVGGVSAEKSRGEQIAEEERRPFVGRGHHRGRRFAADDLLGVSRARQHRHTARVPQLSGEGIDRQKARLLLHALRADDNGGRRRDEFSQVGGHRAQGGRGRHDDHGLGAVAGSRVLGGGADGGRKAVVREVPRVAVLLVDGAGHLRRAGPEHHLVPRFRQHECQRRSPAASSYHCYAHIDPLSWLKLPRSGTAGYLLDSLKQSSMVSKAIRSFSPLIAAPSIPSAELARSRHPTFPLHSTMVDA